MSFTQLEQDLRQYRPANVEQLNLPPHFVWPRYEGRSVGNLASTVGGMLGASLPGSLPPLEMGILDGLIDDVERVVLLVVDALGWVQLRRVMAKYDDLVFHRLADTGRLVPLTTTFLSTTNSVLSAIWTGRPPIEHGLLAYELYLREWMMAVEAIGFSSPFEPFTNTLLRWGFEPERFLPVPSLGQILGPQGITTVTVIAESLTTTPLSRMHFRGVDEVRGHRYASDFWLMLRRALADHRGKRLVLGAYWSAVDALAHRFGPTDESGEAEVRALALLMEMLFLKQLPAKDRERTLLLITADHGQILTPTASVVLLDDHPALRDRLWLPPLGEARVPFFYVRHGARDAVQDYLEEQLGERFTFLSREALLSSGLLGSGTPHPEVSFRLGDVIGIARGDGAFARSAADARRLAGRHGGMMPEEMLVPLLAARLDV